MERYVHFGLDLYKSEVSNHTRSGSVRLTFVSYCEIKIESQLKIGRVEALRKAGLARQKKLRK